MYRVSQIIIATLLLFAFSVFGVYRPCIQTNDGQVVRLEQDQIEEASLLTLSLMVVLFCH
jgi:hypothetical protein